VHFDFGHHGALESECSRKAAASSSSSRRESFALHLAPDEQHLLRNSRLRDTKQNMLAAALLTNLNPISYRINMHFMQSLIGHNLQMSRLIG